MKRSLFAFVALSFFLSSCGSDRPLKTVDKVSLEQYAGTWYEIARLPNNFQKGCACTQAHYELNKKGYVEVTNLCQEDGEMRKVDGKAFPVEGAQNSRLKVQFFWPFKGDYYIIALDEEDYQYAMVGSPDRENLWILAREPQLHEELRYKLINQAKKAGFPVKNLLYTEHNCDAKKLATSR